MEKNLKKNIAEPLCCTPETNTILKINYTWIKKKKKDVGIKYILMKKKPHQSRTELVDITSGGGFLNEYKEQRPLDYPKEDASTEGWGRQSKGTFPPLLSPFQRCKGFCCLCLSTLSVSSLEYLSSPLISDMLENIQQLTFWGLKPPSFSICLLRRGNTLSVQFSLILCDPVEHSTPGFPVHHQLLELAQTHVHRVGDAIQPSHPLSSLSLPAFNLSQHQGLF